MPVDYLLNYLCLDGGLLVKTPYNVPVFSTSAHNGYIGGQVKFFELWKMGRLYKDRLVRPGILVIYRRGKKTSTILKNHFEPITRARDAALLDEFFIARKEPDESIDVFVEWLTR
ncbi:hypothetical protein NPIL_606061 [Nephila pilipes]|uniref:Uncharacterized protein n=1 Tax=Nephila pilipes TaxID=299642 RepID=A0A8X6JEC7_NEPPI|nr:hypothetical protein NPIL_606061 [Nephila pilipes]